jgi:hypothetical protein
MQLRYTIVDVSTGETRQVAYGLNVTVQQRSWRQKTQAGPKQKNESLLKNSDDDRRIKHDDAVLLRKERNIPEAEYVSILRRNSGFHTSVRKNWSQLLVLLLHWRRKQMIYETLCSIRNIKLRIKSRNPVTLSKAVP